MFLLPRLPLLAAALLCMGSLLSAKTLIHAGRLIDGRTDTAHAGRDAIAKGWVEGPRIFAAGGVSTTGGPGDPLADITLMTRISFVMKAGKVYKQ